MLMPMTDEDAQIIHGMTERQVYKMQWSQPRNYKYLQKYMVLVSDVLFEMFNPEPVFFRGVQAHKSVQRFRKDLLIGIGHYELVVNIKNECRAEAKSISFAALDEAGFDRIYRDTISYALVNVVQDKSQTYQTIDNWVSQIIDFA
jgi:hypothetical protein